MNDIPLELKKEFNIDDDEYTAKSKLSDSFFSEKILKNKAVIYSVIFYACGTAIGSAIYKVIQSDAINKFLKPSEKNVSELFTSNICNYMSLFLITVFLAFCLIGYPVINIIPLLIGAENGIKISYFYVNYQTKGIGYTILMIAPFAAMFLCILIFTMETSSALSKSIVTITKKQTNEKLDIVPAIKKFLLYGSLIILCSLISAALETLLKSVVTI